MSVDAANAASGLSGIFGGITTAIKRAAEATGASFEYLLATAKMESNFNPHAAPARRPPRASISSSSRRGSAR
jgi:hypothetical protein